MNIKEVCLSKRLTYVEGEGPKGAKLMIIGEAPGAEEERQKKPFVGGAGFLLDSVLKQAGVLREEVYVTNVVKVKPPQNEILRLKELGLTISDFLPALRDELERVRPNLVLALGALALETLCKEKGIMKWRGSILESSMIKGLKVIPSVHPAAILRQYKWRPLLSLDVKKVRSEMESPEIKIPERNLMIEPTFVEAQDIIRHLIRDKEERIAFDIEVDKDGNMSCISLSSSPNWAISIPFRNGYNSYWSEGQELLIWEWLTELFQSNRLFVAQNALFDMMWLVPRVGYFEMYMDTMICHQTCYAEIPKGLDMLASIYTKEPYYKDERKYWKDVSITRQLWSYNAKDSAVTFEVMLRLEEELKQLKLEDFFFGYVMKLLSVLLKLQMRGIRVDLERREEIKGELTKKKEELEKSFGGVNVRSPKQLAKLLYEDLKLPKQYHRKTGTLTTSKEALIKLRGKI